MGEQEEDGVEYRWAAGGYRRDDRYQNMAVGGDGSRRPHVSSQ
jgi:hypothetical protein